MDANTKKINHIRVKNTIAALEKNNIKAVYVDTKEEALTLFKTMVPQGSYTATGGSMTLRDTGIMDYITSETDYHKDYKDAYNASYYVLTSRPQSLTGASVRSAIAKLINISENVPIKTK